MAVDTSRSSSASHEIRRRGHGSLESGRFVELNLVDDGLDGDKGAGASCLSQIVQQNARLGIEVLESCA